MKRLLWCVLVGALFVPAVAQAQTEEVVYYHTDAIGSVRMITDATGTVLARYDFAPFGEKWDPQPSPDRLQFSGKERDTETGLDYFGARYYRPESARFLSVDPKLGIEVALLDPQRWNRYSYVGNRPTRLIDPDGRGWASTLFKVGRAVVKGEDVYSAVSGIAQETSTIFSMDAGVGTGDRLLATGKLLIDLSGVGDVAAGATKVSSFAMQVGESANSYSRSTFRRNLGRISGAVEDGAHAHHMLPKKFAERFERAGLNPNDPRHGAWWSAQDHLKNARGYNKQCEEFFRANPSASSDEILGFGRDLASKYGLKILF